jgi:hypothetical protein
VPAGCLHRAQIRSIAAGRGTEKELAVVRRHLAECGRCRAAVAARAGGVPGPGETVVLKHDVGKVAPLSIPIKLTAVAMSLAVVAGAWRYAAAPLSAEPKAPTIVSAAIAPASEPFDITPPPPVPQAPRAPVADAGIAQAFDPPKATEPEERAPRRRRVRTSGDQHTRSARGNAQAPSEDEVDFGIDEPLPSRPTVKGRVIRATLE